MSDHTPDDSRKATELEMLKALKSAKVAMEQSGIAGPDEWPVTYGQVCGAIAAAEGRS